MNVQQEIEKFREGLQQQRDELVVQINLAKLEAKEEWEQTEAKLEELSLKLEAAAREARDASDDVWASAKMLGEEIKSAYARIRSRL